MDCSLPGSSVCGILQARILSGLPFPSPGDLPNPEIEPGSPTLQVDSLLSEPPENTTLLHEYLAIFFFLSSPTKQTVRNLYLISRKRRGQVPVIKQRQIRLCLCSPMSGLESEASLWVLADKRWVLHRTVPLHATLPRKRKICCRVRLQCLPGIPVFVSQPLSTCPCFSPATAYDGAQTPPRFIPNYSCAPGS